MKTNEEIAGELWRCIKADFEKKGLSLPDNWNGVGMAYGAYARIIEALEAKDKECEERVREERERIVNSRKFFIQVNEDNITIRPVVLSDLTTTKTDNQTNI